MSYPNDPQVQDTKKHFHLEGCLKLKVINKSLQWSSLWKFFHLDNLQ